MAALLAATVNLTGHAVPAAAALATVTDINPSSSANTDPDAATGGRVNHLATVPGNNQVAYAASEQGGLFKTTNSGASWSHLDGHLPQQTWDVRVDPGSTSHVYATSFYDGRVSSLAGIEESADGGATWTHPASASPPATCGLPAREPSGFGIGIRPDATQNVFVGTNCGVARSTDAGATWTFVDQNAGLVWAVLVEAGGPTGQGIVNVCGNAGFQSSTDGGATWNPGAGLPAGRCSLAASPDESYVLFAAASNNQAYESDNGGANWSVLGFAGTQQGRIPFVRTNKRTNSFDLWYGDVQLFRAGCTTPNPAAPGGALRCPAPANWAGPFTRSAGAHDDAGDLAFDSQTAVDACPRFFSSDGGAHVNTTTVSPACQTPTWSRSNVGLHALWVWGMTGYRSASGLNLFVGTQDDGFQAASNADTTPSWSNPICCDYFSAATDTNRVVGVGCCFNPTNQLFLFSASGTGPNGVSNLPPGRPIAEPEGDPDGNGIVGFNSTSNLVEVADKQYALVTGSGLFFTADVTVNPIVWSQLGAATSPANPCGVEVGISGGTPTFYLQAGSCASSAGGSLWKFTGTGAGSWSRVDTNGGMTGGIGVFGVDSANPNLLYASNLAPAGPRMVSSTDGGQTWTPDPTLDRMMTGSGAFQFANQSGPTNFTGFGGYPQPTLVAFDPSNPAFVVAGGHDSGVFLSADAGRSWDQMTSPANGATNLTQPRSTLFDHPGGSVAPVVYVGTQGRGVWRLTPRPATLQLTGPTTADFNDSVTLSARLLDASVGPQAPIAGAAVTFQLGAQTCTGTSDSTGLASCPLQITQAPGAYPLTATFAGDGSRLSSTTSARFAVTREDTTTALTSSANPSGFGQPVTIIATVSTDQAGTASPTGSVTFTRGANKGAPTIAIVPLSGGTASVTLNGLQVGANVIGASYSGDTNFVPSGTTLTQTVTCTRTLSGTLTEPVIVDGGSTCLVNATAEDGVFVNPGGALSVSGSTLREGLFSQGAQALTVCGSAADGLVQVFDSTGFVLIGDGGDESGPACAGSRFDDPVTLGDNQGQVELGGNALEDGAIVNETSGTGPDPENTAPEIEANTIGGLLLCSGNSPAPTNDGHPNTFAQPGLAQGQCSGL